MQTPVNPFKKALAEKRAQIGLWMCLANSVPAEICAGAGYDWLLIDGEHSPNDLDSILHQAQAIAAYPGVNAVARVPVGHGNVGTALLKQYLDLGVQNLLVPMVDTAEQAAAVVKACRYPPLGIRGMGGSRASRWGRYSSYGKEANDQVCVLVQVETREAVNNIDAIVATEGVDGVFIGPADLSAALGYVGQRAHPEVTKVIEDCIRRIVKGGKAAGILTGDEALAKRYLELGATFVAVGVDTTLLVQATSNLLGKFKAAPDAAKPSGY